MKCFFDEVEMKAVDFSRYSAGKGKRMVSFLRWFSILRCYQNLVLTTMLKMRLRRTIANNGESK